MMINLRIAACVAIMFIAWIVSLLLAFYLHSRDPGRDFEVYFATASALLFSFVAFRLSVFEYCRSKGGVAVFRILLNSRDSFKQWIGMFALATLVGNRFGITANSVQYWRVWIEGDGYLLKWNRNLGRFVDPKYENLPRGTEKNGTEEAKSN